MEKKYGKKIFNGIAIGRIRFYAKTENRVSRTEIQDVEKEIARLEKEAAKLEGEIKRASGMLNNEKFVSKAPAAKVEAEKEKLAKYQAMAEQVAERLSQLRK